MSDTYYDHDGITIYHADNADVEWPDPADVGLLLTDPPYGIGHDPQHPKYQGSSNPLYASVVGDDGPFDPTPLLVYHRCIIWGGNCFASALPDHPGWIVWDKVTQPTSAMRGAELELAWTNCVSRPMMFRHLWRGAYRDSEHGSYLHPTQKPVALMRWSVDKWTKPGDLVFDPYMGSGPVARACLDLGRRYVGIEIVEEYCEAAVDRLGQLALALEDV